MAAFELEYLQHTYTNNIVNNCTLKCNEDRCCCLDVLQLSLLSIVLKDTPEVADGKLYKFYDIFHILAKNNNDELFTLDKCGEECLKKYSDIGIFFDSGKIKKTEVKFEKALSLERRAIDFLGVAIYILNTKYDNAEEKGYRDCDKWLLDAPLLNPRLLLVVSINMFYGLLKHIEYLPEYQDAKYIEQYIKLIKDTNERFDSIWVRDLRSEIISNYQEIFKDNLYNVTELAERFAEYFYSLTFEKSQVEEINSLGNLDYFCAVLEQFSKHILREEQQKKIMTDYIKGLRKIMESNLSQDTKYLPAQYRKGEIGRLNKTIDFRKEIEAFCKKYHLFLVDMNFTENETKPHFDKVNREKKRRKSKIIFPKAITRLIKGTRQNKGGRN